MAERASPKVTTSRPRWLGYALTFLSVVLLFLLGYGLHGTADGTAYTVIAVLIAATAAVISVLALIRYYVRKRSTYLWLGAGFAGASVLEVYHALQVAGFTLSISVDRAEVVQWSWFACQFALAMYLFFSWLADWRRTHRPLAGPFPAWAVYVFIIGTTIGAVVAMVVVPPPGPYYQAGLVGRPLDLLPAIPLLATLIGYLVEGTWRKSSIQHALIIALILLTGSQVLLMPFSRELFDPLFYLGQVGTLVGYIAILAGLLASTYRVFKLSETRRMESLRKAFDLTKEKSRVLQSLSDVQRKELELKRKVGELETTRSAVLNVMEDLETEKKNLASEKAKDEAILASVGEGLIVTDEQRRITYMNHAAEQETGFTQKEAMASVWPDIVHPRSESGEPIPPEQYVGSRALATLSIRSTPKPEVLVRKDGTTFAATVTAAPVLLNQRALGIIIVFRDITKEREIDKAKTEFVSLASHQLRTPLSTIKWYAEMLLEGDAGKLSASQQDYMREVSQANERMVDLVNALLNVSRIELGTFTIKPVPTDVVATARTVTSELAPQVALKHLTLHEEYAKGLPLLPADPNLLRIVVQNLMTNAVKYTPEKGEVWLRVRLAKTGETIDGHTVPNDSLLVSVQDTGYGIPSAAQPKIFTKLYRADNVRERDTDGTGLGLYLVKSIVDRAEGDVWFSSVENKGSTFNVVMPITGMQPRAGTRELT